VTRGGETNPAGGAGDDGDAPVQRPHRGFRELELGLFEAPVLDLEELALRNGPVAAERRRVQDHARGVRVQIAGDARFG
jgi:hypothetical protein